jgi:hypothetical protein
VHERGGDDLVTWESGFIGSRELLRRWSENGRTYYAAHLSRERAMAAYLALTRDAIAGY